MSSIQCPFCGTHFPYGATVCPSCWANVKYGPPSWVTGIGFIWMCFCAFVGIGIDWGWWGWLVFFGLFMLIVPFIQMYDNYYVVYR
jgi:hypothetical protein